LTKREGGAVVKPFLKWPGGKYRILEQVKSKLVPGQRLIEPFVGSGAVFLNTEYPEYLLSDINEDLINLYIVLQREGEAFINYCSEFFIPENNIETRFYELRDEFNNTNDALLKAALFVYLNKHGYNGLCRYNSNGGFNVPFGRYTKPYFPREEMLYFFTKSQNAVIRCQDFRQTMRQARRGDVIYCDPPYVPLSPTSNFTSYSAGGFGEREQLELADRARALARQGITVVISNHNTEFVLAAYEEAEIETFEVRRFISCDGANRNKVGELLAVFAFA
jgi:DNA adenine methylase